MAKIEPVQEANSLDSYRREIEQALEKTRRELKEINLMVDHSQIEVAKLKQRNASVTAHLQQVQSQFASMPREDIRQAYDAALDAQQRLFYTSNQVEKLQSDRSHHERFQKLAEQTLALLDSGSPVQRGRRTDTSTAERVEMMIQAQEAERQRLSRQMHDGPAQALSNFILQTEIAMRLFDMDQTKAREELSNLKMSATGTFQKVRDFIFELRPMMLDDLGLAPTLKRYIDAAKNQSGMMDVRLTVTGMERRLESYLEVMIFRAVQELLGNAIRHSQATQVSIHLDMGEQQIRIQVEDNGRGFNVDVIEERQNMGVKVIRERVEMLGGFIEIDSVAGQGTRVNLQVPAGEPRTTPAHDNTFSGLT